MFSLLLGVYVDSKITRIQFKGIRYEHNKPINAEHILISLFI